MGPYGFVDSYEYIAGSCCLCLQVEAVGTFATLAYINQTVRHHNGEEWCCGTALISCQEGAWWIISPGTGYTA
jgi:hypothetical protein